jgi:hypothetical protein
MIPVTFTVDTEPDNVWKDFRSRGLANIQHLRRFHAFMTDRGAPPTYLLTHSVVTDRHSVRLLHELERIGPLEIGAHLHAWETPPYLPSGHDRDYQVFAHDLPAEHVHAKLEELTRLIAQEFGPPVSYRAGRFGFATSHIGILESLNYLVDSSVTPLADRRRGVGLPVELGGKRGRDYRTAPLNPYHPSYYDDLMSGNSCLLEVPVTVGPTRAGGLILAAYRHGPQLVQRFLRKSGVSDLIIASIPEKSWPCLHKMILTAIAGGRSAITFIMHSSELMVGGAPWIADDSALEALYTRLEECVKLLSGRSDVQFMTLGQLARNQNVSTRIADHATASAND